MNLYSQVFGTPQRWLAALLLLAACKKEGGAPELAGIDDQLAAVGTELVIDLRADDPDGDEIEYGFFAELDGIDDEATITRRADGGGVFRWTPLAEDVGLWYFDFTASDGRHTDTVTVAIDVRSTLGEGTVPVFREPLGSGTTLDLEQSACVEFPVIVDDQDDTEVVLGIEPPGIVGAELVADGGLSGTFSWCPTKEQMADDRHPVVLSADDGDHSKTLKNYLIVLRKAPNPDCPGEAPVIEHEPADIETVLDVQVAAHISDDVGLKQPPLLYFSLVEPHQPVDFAELDVVEMVLEDGDMTDGQWRGTIENPVANMPEGTSAPIWYLISAGDNDDAAGDCDHVTDAPEDGTFTIQVTNGGGGGLPICEPCSADVQCGTDDDLCVPLGAANDGYCGTDCDTDTDCDADFTCEPVESKDGMVAKQCVPVSGECEVGPPPCEDDAFEENDTRQQAQAAAAFDPDSYTDLVSCGGDEDWYRVIVDEDTMLGAVVEGGAASNLNLGLLDSAGAAVEVSEGPDSSEVVETCVEAGTYYVRVYAFEDVENGYDLLIDATPETCAAVCEDDDLEEDDTQQEAHYAEVVGGYETTDRMLCADDDDWYEIALADMERIEVDLTFVDDGPLEDLDLHFHDADGVDLTPCTEQMPATCSAAQGQSADSNEHYEFTLSDAACTPADLCTFYVRVHGFAGSQNSYDLAIEWFLAN